MFVKGDLFLDRITFNFFVFDGTQWLKLIPVFTNDKDNENS